MACGATLKRSLEFDPLHSPSQNSPKRRRCMPMTLSPSTPPPKSQIQSPFGDVSPKMTPEQIAANISLEIRRMQRRRQLAFQTGSGNGSSGSPGPLSPGRSSPSISDSSSNLTLMPMDYATGAAHLLVHGSSSSDRLAVGSSSQHFGALSPSKRDVPLFTFKQVSLICERMLKDRECQIREEYNSVLTSKLAEQYEAFLKFNHDMLHRRFADIPASYVS